MALPQLNQVVLHYERIVTILVSILLIALLRPLLTDWPTAKVHIHELDLCTRRQGRKEGD